MTLEKRIEAFAALGYALEHMSDHEREGLLARVQNNNPWFTQENTEKALHALQRYLKADKLRRWTQHYDLEAEPLKNVGVIMAGNIPLVGFHDMLSVLIAGHRLLAKPSSQDAVLPKYVISILKEIAPELGDRVTFAQEPMKTMEAVIATGSNNSARYFEHYFNKFPNIIRKNRTSVAVLKGDETEEQMVALGQDVFQYFGLGCRNVSKLFVPEGYDFIPLLDAWQVYQPIISNSKYSNNYDYHKSIMLVNREAHLDTGFLMLKEEKELVSPTTVLYYEHYTDAFGLGERLAEHDDQIQCLVGQNMGHPRAVGFGEAQEPELWDYADGVDTLAFLSQLK